jgi:hypothetical protein
MAILGLVGGGDEEIPPPGPVEECEGRRERFVAVGFVARSTDGLRRSSSCISSMAALDRESRIGQAWV